MLVLLVLVPIGANAQTAASTPNDPLNQFVDFTNKVGGAATGRNDIVDVSNAAGAAVSSGVGAVANATMEAFLKAAVVPLFYLIFTLCSWILGIAGVLFNWAVIRTVFQFASFFGNSQSLLTAWGILRDVGNIVLLFGFIFMGVSTILDLPHSEYTARRALPSLIIFAVLLNFSLFAAEAVIDVANGFSSVLATEAGQNCPDNSTAQACASVGISGTIFGLTGGTAIFADPIPDGKVTVGNSSVSVTAVTQIIIYALLALFLIIVAFVLLAGAIMLIARAVLLVFLIILSPIGFAGMAIPPLHGLAEQWWHQLIRQSFFAPVYLLLVFISILLAKGMASGTNGNLAAAFVGTTDQVGGTSGGLQIVLVFCVVVGFMVFALIASKRMGAAGADFATKTASTFTFGAASFVAQRTAGRALYSGAQAIRKTNFGRTGIGRFAAETLDKGGKSTFDARGLINAVPGGNTIKLNKPQKEGYAGKLHEEEEKRVKYAASLKKTDAEIKEQKDLEASNVSLTDANENLKQAIEQATTAHRAELNVREGRLRDQQLQSNARLQPARDALQQKRRQLEAARAPVQALEQQLAAAQAAGAPNAAALEQQVSAARAAVQPLEAEYNNDLQALQRSEADENSYLEIYRNAVKEETDQYNATVQTHRDNIKRNEDQIKANQSRHKEINKQPQQDFERSLHSNNPLDILGGIGMDANHHAAEKILRDLNKTDEQKLADAYNAAAARLQSAQNTGGGGGGGGGAAPAGGGGGGAAPH